MDGRASSYTANEAPDHAAHGGLPAPAPFPPEKLMTDTTRTVSHALAEDRAATPSKAAARLFPKPWFFKRLYRRFYIKWDLLHIYADVLLCLTRDPLAGNVSPSLIGTSGTCPLSIVSTIPDIMRHYSDCIVMAEKEVFLVTNYWQPSDSVKAVSEALVELNERIRKRSGQKVVVKIMWDRGAIQQLWRNHVFVRPKTWVPLGLPDPETVPNLSIQTDPTGTFHQKTMVVDRKVALLNSNNIQDRPNVEMMVHLEGPIVDSLYDNLLLSWDRKFIPKLPCLQEPSPYADPEKPFGYTFQDANPWLANIDIAQAAKAARILLARQREAEQSGQVDNKQTSRPQWWQYENWDWDWDIEDQAAHRPRNPDGFASMVQQFIERTKEEAAKALGDKDGGRKSLDQRRHSYKATAAGPSSPPSPTAASSASTKTPTPLANGNVAKDLETKHSTVTGTPLPNSNGDSVHQTRPTARDEPSESSRSTSTTASATTAAKTSERLQALSKSLNAGALTKIEAAIDDELLIEDFVPHKFHKEHEPFPIALVNRRPHGAPGHNDIRTPQDAAWLAALRYAEKKVFIQTPTLNAAPIVRGVIEACSKGGRDKQGIVVEMILGLGFNDKGESVPFQGGTNEEVVVRLFKALKKVNKEHNLHVYWYTGKDQMRPLNAVHKSRNCHVKFMAVDDQCAIVGNGNLDTQSFMHSQEANVLVDSPQVVKDWLEQLRTNQSSHKYGRVDTDGIWRDQQTGEQLEKPKDVNIFSAMYAMVKK
ncbi:hypothetical protein OIV83_000919 [Microbotryomycetes sp. JL201]|nr:hypothetical protein OIV83_000919 [Microbotryomycetes sp. JL201]